MEDAETIKQRMLAEGFTILNEYDDEADEEFPDHSHPAEQLLIVLRGSISVTMDGKTSVLNPGDEFYFPAHVVHSAKVGPEGCLYLDGERPEHEN